MLQSKFGCLDKPEAHKKIKISHFKKVKNLCERKPGTASQTLLLQPNIVVSKSVAFDKKKKIYTSINSHPLPV